MDFSKIPKKIILLVGIVAAVGGIVGLIAVNLQGGGGNVAAPKLTVWGVLDEGEMNKLFDVYKGSHEGATFDYRKVAVPEYEKTLLDALAAGQGPDIFMIRNRWLPKQINKIVPAPRGELSSTQFENYFPKVVAQDFTTSDGTTYALPIFLDTLALFYNKDVFDQAAISDAPKTWQEFQNLIPRFRSISPSGQIVKAAAAIGGSQKTIGVAVDLLHLLMLQNGVPMVDVASQKPVFISPETGSPGVAAFNFYLQFANAGSPYYTWNENQEPDVDVFASGKAAMMFGYRSTISKIREKSPFLRLGMQGAPQVSASGDAINYADYWGFAVSRWSKNSLAAWNFISQTLTNVPGMRGYAKSTGRPPALKPLMSEFLGDPELGVFAKQAFTARSWYQVDDEKIANLFSSAISRVLTGQTTSQKALDEIEAEVVKLLR